MNPTRNPLNSVQIAEIKHAGNKKLGEYHLNLLSRLIGEHAALKMELSNAKFELERERG
jgi:hypothetical protein